MKVRDVMTRNVVAVRPRESVRDVAAKLASRNIGGCPVVDEENRVVGIISESDILGGLKTQYKSFKILMPPDIPYGVAFAEQVKEREALKAFEEVASAPVEQFMIKKVVTASPEDTIEKAIQLMVKNNINRLPVVEDSKLVGIVTRGDVLRGMAQKIETR